VKKDIEFFDALLAKLQADYRIDADRIYVIGMSNGGYFAHLVGKERSTLIAAVASHSGPLGLQKLLGINAEQEFLALIMHGDQDKLFSVNCARENRDKYKREGHEVNYVGLAGQGARGERRRASTRPSRSSSLSAPGGNSPTTGAVCARRLESGRLGPALFRPSA
jgi:poly(3-hydroxybutyrate) depolymerase